MTSQEFTMVYKSSIYSAYTKSNNTDGVEKHYCRCFAFFLASNMYRFNYKELGAMIYCGCLPSCANEAELTENLNEFYDTWSGDDWVDGCQQLWDHITEYFNV